MKTLSEYAWASVSLPTGGTMPEPTPEERKRALKADQVGHAELARERGWSESDVSLAQRCGLLPQGGDCGGARMIDHRQGRLPNWPAGLLLTQAAH